MFDLFISPFVEFAFMRQALVGAVILAASLAPLGVFLMLRRMSMTGDAIAHGILPGVALGFLGFGLSLVPMTLGGLVAGLAVALLAGLVSRVSILREDASLAAFYLISLALGVLLVSLRGSSVDLTHVLFGNVLGLETNALQFAALVATLTFIGLAVLWRALVADSLDPSFLAGMGRSGSTSHFVFLAMVVLNLVAGFQSFGTLLSVGLMILPAAAARFWSKSLGQMCLLASLFGVIASVTGLLISYHASLASGPAIILVAGALYVVSLLFAPRGIFPARRRGHRHRTA